MARRHERKSWDDGSGVFVYRFGGPGTIFFHKPLADGRLEVGRCTFKADSSFCKHLPNLKLIEMVEPPEAEHVWQLPVSMHAEATAGSRAKEAGDQAKALAAIEIERERESFVLASEISEAFLADLPDMVDEVRVVFNFWGKGRAEAERALRSIAHVIAGRLTSDDPIPAKKRSKSVAAKLGDVDKMSYEELLDAAARLGVSHGRALTRGELHGRVVEARSRLAEAFSDRSKL